ncbi:hypothetical protein [Massilia sp. S19_KUP03_FR1]|uniref:hypothetical protein n=1 Tax=Massilia sp. S19_KUP03_FR1 TaxID=3025503 RepID=UPI002FCDB225
MNTGNESHALADKLSAPLAKIVDRHKDKISALLLSGSTSTVGEALGKDENVRRVASFCYPLLPGLLRLVVKEHMFINFVMQNRERLLAHLPPPLDAHAA